MKRTCKQCGKEFELEASEIRFYQSKNLELPKRCKECRGKNKQRRQNEYSKKAPYKAAAMLVFILAAFVTVLWNRIPGDDRQQDFWVPRAVTKESEQREKPQTWDFTASGAIDGTEKAEQKKELPETEYTEGIEKAQAEQTPFRGRTFRSEALLSDHYEKHGMAMGFASAAEYEAAAAKVAENPDSLHKLEAEDGDDVYYLESTNEFVIVSTDGYIRTYFYPEDGIEYYNRQ